MANYRQLQDGLGVRQLQDATGNRLLQDSSAAAGGQPTVKRWSQVPHLGGLKRFAQIGYLITLVLKLF